MMILNAGTDEKALPFTDDKVMGIHTAAFKIPPCYADVLLPPNWSQAIHFVNDVVFYKSGVAT